MDGPEVEGRNHGPLADGDDLLTSDAALRIALERFGRFGRGARVENGVLLTCGPAGSSGPYAHAVFRLTRACRAERLLTLAGRHASWCGAPVGVWTRSHADADIEAAARAAGFGRLSDPPLTGMVVATASLPARLPPRAEGTVTRAEGTVTRAQDPSVLAAVVAAAFGRRGVSVAAASALVGNALLLNAEGTHAFLAVGDGQPVASALAFVEPPYGVLTFIGTIPSARRHGAATAVTLAAMRAAIEGGSRKLGLQATQGARRLYQGLGFADVTEYPCYLVPPSAAR